MSQSRRSKEIAEDCLLRHRTHLTPSSLPNLGNLITCAACSMQLAARPRLPPLQDETSGIKHACYRPSPRASPCNRAAARCHLLSSVFERKIKTKQLVCLIIRLKHDAPGTLLPLSPAHNAFMVADHLHDRKPHTSPPSTRHRGWSCVWRWVSSIWISLWQHMHCRQPSVIIRLHLPCFRAPSSILRSCCRLPCAFRPLSSIFVLPRCLLT